MHICYNLVTLLCEHYTHVLHVREKLSVRFFSVHDSTCVFYTMRRLLSSFDYNILTVTQEDYEELTTLLIFRSCDGRKYINVTVRNNDIAEKTESFILRLERTTNLHSRIILNPENATVQIADNDGTYAGRHSSTYETFHVHTKAIFKGCKGERLYKLGIMIPEYRKDRTYTRLTYVFSFLYLFLVRMDIQD